MDEQLALYEKVAIISLAELAGKEHVIGDAFLAHVLEYNSPDMIYITFDFHEYCRGMRFENVSILTDGIKDIIKDMRYTWLDTKGAICEQRGVFRVNCVDCLDRTNFRKLGLLPPEESLPSSCRKTYQQIWANNGDVISRQYAGTAALKGDYTRTGERKFSGVMKDGVNSANRYYLRFRDAYCQAAIDLTLGQPVSPGLLAPTLDITGAEAIDEREEDEEDEAREREENARTMIEDCKRMLIVEPEHCLGAWGLVNATPGDGDSDQIEMDMILLLSQRSVYVCWYDDDLEQVTRYQRIYLEDVDKIEIGMEPAVFKSKHQVLRLTYHHQADEGLYHMFRVPSARLFNNKATAVQSAEEIKESLRLVADTFRCAQEIMSIQLEIVDKPKLDRRKPSPHPEVMDIHQQQQENSLACIQLPRDVSTELQPVMDAASNPSHLQPQANSSQPSVPAANARPKSPLEYISSLPKQSLVSALSRVSKGAGEGDVSKSSTNSASKFSLPKPNLKVNFQNMGVIRRIKDASFTSRAVRFTRSAGAMFADESGDQYDSGIDVPDGEALSGRDCSAIESEHAEVVMDGCGILASSPKQVLLSHIQLQTEGKQRLSQSESPLSHSPAIIAGTVASLTTFDSSEATPAENFLYPEVQSKELPACLKHNKSQVDGDCSADVDRHHENIDKETTKTTEMSVSEVGLLDNQRNKSTKENSLGDGPEDAFCVIETENVHEILSRCHQLHHPLMKTSHSDTSLSAMGGGMVDGAAAPDASLMSRLKLKMTSLSRPLAGSSGFTSYVTLPGKSDSSQPGAPNEVPVHTKTHIRKSQRAMDVFEKLLKEKLPTMECKSRFIFI
ncbi:phosphatidylinositide phosphatase SAC2 [Elysia marginata]|uniref:Phosphatidylinositide phosphatase SAC2 n=1 Tax=Elysia marginata TaxID=1093978 RepID=A0AAV4J652_9GAST|nr:phosphatidylinositide phosphatase SAC2 [Elysia marginata]